MTAHPFLVLAAVERGWYVIPLCWPDARGRCACPKHHANEREIGKAPLLGNGYQEARWTREEVRGYWTRWPDANYGILLAPSGLFVLDADSAAADREVEALGCPPGPRVRRGDHTHRYFSTPAGIQGRAIHTGVSGKIDILTEGYVVGPGSLHRSGDRYSEEVSFGECDLEEPPRWALDLLRPSTNGTGGAVALPVSLPTVDLATLGLPRPLTYLIRGGQTVDPTRYKSRSEAVFGVLVSLLHCGVKDPAILAAIILDPLYGISEMPREKGKPWMAGEIARAQAKGQERETPPPEAAWSQDARAEPPETNGEAPPARTAVLIRLSEVSTKPVRWLWRGRIPLGKVTVLDGDPGLGKSLFSTDLAARVTRRCAP